MRRPRFITSESSGYRITAEPGGGSGNNQLVTEVMVLDRAYCHRVVWSSLTSSMEQRRRYFTFSRKGGPKTWRWKTWRATARLWPLERRRQYAADLAARLNAEDERGPREETAA